MLLLELSVSLPGEASAAGPQTELAQGHAPAVRQPRTDWRPLLCKAMVNCMVQVSDAMMMLCRGTMLCLLLWVGLLGAASAAGPQAKTGSRTSIETATNSLLRGAVTEEAAVRIENVLNALGNSNITMPTQQYNPDLPEQGPPVQVPDIQPAPWHSIARPENAICAVSRMLVKDLLSFMTDVQPGMAKALLLMYPKCSSICVPCQVMLPCKQHRVMLIIYHACAPLTDSCMRFAMTSSAARGKPRGRSCCSARLIC